jgi:hypothetical protein
LNVYAAYYIGNFGGIKQGPVQITNIDIFVPGLFAIAIHIQRLALDLGVGAEIVILDIAEEHVRAANWLTAHFFSKILFCLGRTSKKITLF